MNDPTVQEVVDHLHDLAKSFYKTEDIEFRCGRVAQRYYVRLFVKGKDEGTFCRTDLMAAFAEVGDAIGTYAQEEHDILVDCQRRADMDDRGRGVL
jgi:hypothetical protein